MIPDELFMQRALELARRGTGQVSPNPRVGCVIVYNDKIIGEGWHENYGGPHAEVRAVDSVEDKSLLRHATVFVTLEPCSHTGKTPPCADLLIRHGVKKVVISNPDPNPLVNGQGIKKLTDAGIEVVTGVLEKAGRHLNRRFFMFIEKKRPYVILKWAQTADGFIARSNYDSKWISNELSRQWVHRWRSEEDAVMVGSHTALHDNPQLTVRDWSGRDPIKVVIDRQRKLPANLNIWKGPAKTLCYNQISNEKQDTVEFIKPDDGDFIAQVIGNLYQRKIQSVIVEGGAGLLRLFIEASQWDEARIFTSPDSFGDGIAAPAFHGSLISTDHIESDELKIYQNKF